ncbi:Anaphase-promoting complex subunit 5 [Phytophthora infestans]|uniref:Anaphase-promoting complex subunit 5 n=1 Tax=Phytophthora infestans TaxID=4787 RepID=A0A8S9U361_PHYIN|nr:Anaphase-promoting complex subunit 5 [Phytophthora infestans]
MRKWKANSYLLSVCLLVSEYVRQQQQDAKLSSAGEDLVASLVDAPHTQPAPPVISRTSLNALARFLTLEIQHPLKTNPDTSSRTGFTTLKSLLRRLEISLDNEQDFEQVSWQLVSILTQIKSPDSVCNVVEQISECVTPLQTVRDEEDVEIDVDSANATLVRTSLLGVFVRSFLLEVNRLLFDGLSRLFDDVQQYLEQFREDMEKDKKLEEKDNSLELVGSPASQNLWNEDKMDDDELLLSPIHSGSATPSQSTRQNTLMTPAPTRLDSYVLTDKLLTPDAVREVNDPAVWSNDQLNYILSDMIRGMEGGRTAQRSQHIEDQSMEEQLRLLRNKMDGSNPNVLFARYLSFLNDRDYQGALDSLHQYHDVLSPRQKSRAVGSDSDGNSSAATGLTGGSGLHFRGSGIQYAALNLAGLQILFDHCTAAQENIQEAIRVAQHHGDHICVAFALAWLIRINQKMGNSKDAVLQLVSSCFDRAQELRLPSLQVLATLTEVESDLLRGSTARSETLASTSHFVPHRIAAQAPAPRPLHIWSRLEESLQSIASIATPAANMSNSGTRTMVALQLQAGVASVTDSSNKSGGTGMDWIKSTEAILDTVWSLSGKVAISAAVGWSLYGQRSLEEVFNRIHLLCYEDSAGIGEIALTVSQMAMSSLTQTTDRTNVYERALRFLVGVADGGHHAARHYLLYDMVYQRTVHRLFFLWALQRGEFARAEVHLNAILAFSPDGKDFPAYLDALLLKAALWTAVGDYPRSLELLECIEVTCREHGFTYLHAQVLIATSRTRFQASAPHAPFASLNALLKGVDICTSHHYDLLLAEAHVVMAEVYIAMGKLQDAHSLLNDQMPLVMEHGSIDLRGECLLVLAKTLIASIKRRNEGAKEPTPAATKAIEMLNASTDMFSLVQNVKRLKEISYVQSLVYNHLATQSTKIGGDSTAFYTCREEAAARFLKHNSQLKRAAFRTIEPFFDLELPENIRQSITHRSSEIETVQ